MISLTDVGTEGYLHFNSSTSSEVRLAIKKIPVVPVSFRLHAQAAELVPKCFSDVWACFCGVKDEYCEIWLRHFHSGDVCVTHSASVD